MSTRKKEWGDLTLSIENGQATLAWGNNVNIELGECENINRLYDILPTRFIEHDGYSFTGWDTAQLDAALAFRMWQSGDADSIDTCRVEVEEWFVEEVRDFLEAKKRRKDEEVVIPASSRRLLGSVA